MILITGLMPRTAGSGLMGTMTALRNVEPEYRAEAWAQSSTLGVMWKEVFDRYNIAGIVRGECEFPSGVDDGELMVIEFAYKLFGELTY